MTSLKKILRGNEIAYGYRIGYLFNHFVGPVYRWSGAELGLHRPDFATLFCAAHVDAATASDVVLLTGIPKNSVSRAVSKLIEQGMLRAEADESDGRRALLRLTAKGRKIHDEMLGRLRERQDGMLSTLTAAERVELNRLLNKLVERDDDWAAAN
jgi:DNA-binding MarR family transcriptional regulator